MFRPPRAVFLAVLATPVVLAVMGCGGKSSIVSPSGDRFRLLPGLAKGPGRTPLPKSFGTMVEKDPFPTAAERGLIGQ
ncbi:MAG TPA: hypothetical protein VND64_34955 [Pirellulales bacterium]|nr:hypothetical protein [Pirellulales bacterium]